MTNRSTDDRTLIHQLLTETYRDYVMAHNAVGYAKLYTENPLWAPPNAPNQSSREGIMQAAQGLFNTFHFQVKPQAEEIEVLGDMAYAFGTVDGVLTPRNGGDPKPIQFAIFWLLHRTTAGWQIHRQIWNNKPIS